MYFVTLNHPNGGVVPLMDENDQVATFDSHEQAVAGLESNTLGAKRGGTIYNTEEDGTVI